MTPASSTFLKKCVLLAAWSFASDRARWTSFSRSFGAAASRAAADSQTQRGASSHSGTRCSGEPHKKHTGPRALLPLPPLSP
eukprot:CAMPEP_0198587006 /NCGR_PEP_ID=MMETSP1462-20131121/131310_1 /TAXON_ID=1333877 /ORGANISM="Brandtodinium nutriculum, Strain RCC3387" /LENGTH=81 /DNA_ID=CAMNT_0044318473 /DNA_START=21 /DNA_END=262 /DNA_ORIENTATION=+